jgi:hypothetical protein
MSRSAAVRRWLAIQLLLGFLVLVCGVVQAQQTRTLNVGELYFLLQEGFADWDMRYPQSWSFARSIYSGLGDNNLDMLHNACGFDVGVKRTWTDPGGAQHDVQVAMANPQKCLDIQTIVVPVSGTYKRYYRNPYPQKVLDGKNRTDVVAQGDPVNPDLPSDVMIYQKANCWPNYGMGIQVECWAYALAHPDYDDFVILEFVITNTSNENRNDVYFGFRAETSSHTHYEDADLWGNYYGVTYWKYAQGDRTGDSLRIYYSWCADDKAEAGDSKARPHPQWGHFREPQYSGFVLLHADKSPDDESDDPRQPVKAGWSQRELSPDLKIATHEVMYDFLSKPWDPANPTSYAMHCDENYNESPNGMYRVLRPGINVRDYDMLTEQEKSGFMSFGPYQMKPGDDVRIVIAFVAGTIPLRWAIDLGRAYENGYPQQATFGLVPLPYDIVNPFTGELMVPRGSILHRSNPADVRLKDAVIDLGKQYVFQHASRAVRLWKSSNVKKGQGRFNLPVFAPASPSLYGFSEYDQVRLQWGNEAERDTRAGTITKYRIYRDYKRPPAMTSPTDTTFLLLAEVPATSHEYIDKQIVRGDKYYYYITAVNDKGIESSMFLNMTGTSQVREDEALTPTRGPDPDWTENVVVVPNPFHAAGATKYPGRRLTWLNLPAYCNIRIYTMTGDLVQMIKHVSGSGTDDWLRQDTFSTMEIVSGVYIYVIEELDGPHGKPTGKKAIGKFVVIK